MKTIEIQNEHYDFPEAWEEVTFDQYKEVGKLLQQNLNTLSFLTKVLEIVTGIDEETINKINFEELRPIVSDITFLLNTTPDTIELDESTTVEIGGEQFYLRPYSTITVGEALFIEGKIDEYENAIDIIDYAFGVLLRPFDENGEWTYTDFSKINDHVEFLKKNMYVSQVHSLTLFFSEEGTSFIDTFLNYFHRNMEEKTDQQNTDSKD